MAPHSRAHEVRTLADQGKRPIAVEATKASGRQSGVADVRVG